MPHNQLKVKAYIEYKLYEYDPQNADDYVGAGGFNGVIVGGTYDIDWRKIGKFADGTNKKAEFYVKHAENFKTSAPIT